MTINGINVNKSETSKLYIEFIGYLKEELNKLESEYNSDLDSIKEFCDENLEYNRGSDYELMVDNLNSEYKILYSELISKGISRGVSLVDMVGIFGIDDVRDVVNNYIDDDDAHNYIKDQLYKALEI